MQRVPTILELIVHQGTVLLLCWLMPSPDPARNNRLTTGRVWRDHSAVDDLLLKVPDVVLCSLQLVHQEADVRLRMHHVHEQLLVVSLQVLQDCIPLVQLILQADVLIKHFLDKVAAMSLVDVAQILTVPPAGAQLLALTVPPAGARLPAKLGVHHLRLDGVHDRAGGMPTTHEIRLASSSFEFLQRSGVWRICADSDRVTAHAAAVWLTLSVICAQVNKQ